MTDITRLTQEMKAAAEKAKHAGEAPVMPFDTWISMLNKYQITVCPDNILALVAALELKEEQREKVKEIESATAGTTGHEKARRQRQVLGEAKPRLKTRKEITKALESAEGEYADALRWVIGEAV